MKDLLLIGVLIGIPACILIYSIVAQLIASSTL